MAYFFFGFQIPDPIPCECGNEKYVLRGVENELLYRFLNAEIDVWVYSLFLVAAYAQGSTNNIG